MILIVFVADFFLDEFGRCENFCLVLKYLKLNRWDFIEMFRKI